MPMERGYWFPAKRYGWGWGFPVRWQGWAVFFAFFLALVIGGLLFMPRWPLRFVAFAAVASLALSGVCYAKGEPPRWRRGE
jgi:hypothetical protein